MKIIKKLFKFLLLLVVVGVGGLIGSLLIMYNFSFKLNDNFLDKAYNNKFIENDQVQLMYVTYQPGTNNIVMQTDYKFYNNVLEIRNFGNEDPSYILYVEEAGYLKTYTWGLYNNIELVSNVEITESHIQSIKASLLSNYVTQDYYDIEGRSYLYEGDLEYDIQMELFENQIEFIHYENEFGDVTITFIYSVNFPPDIPDD